ncbi:acetylxylan esterase [Candidatus Sumerlaeota bacterium]|nr:acetylxylan esterase [Candidatus Sumerlaeota bacterium]
MLLPVPGHGKETTESSSPDALNVLEESGDSLLHDYLLEEMRESYARRRADLERAFASAETLEARQERLRTGYRDLIGSFPERTPLNARVTGAIEGDGYRIEKVVYESWPRHHATASLYLPTEGKGPFPGVLVVCGHIATGKASADEELVCLLLVRNGFAVLCVDPIGQGERYQLLNPQGEPTTRGGTLEHTLVNVGGMLVRRGTVKHELWDNMRGIDYLVSRPEIDPDRIGCTGYSGGGTQTTFLMAFDDRVEAAGPCCYLMTLEDKFAWRPADGCQHLAGEGAEGIETADYIEMVAPKPIVILAALRDMFDIESTRRIYREARRVYDALGHPDGLDMFEWDDGHTYSKPRRQAAAQWFRRWLADDASPVLEPDEVAVYPPESLQVSQTGQALTEWRGANVIDLNLQTARNLAPARESFWRDHATSECLARVRALIGWRDDPTVPTVETVGEIASKGCRIEKLVLRRQGEVPVPALLFVPDGATEDPLPATLYVDSRGKDAEAGPDGEIWKLVREGRLVLSIDARGYGETADNPKDKDAKKFWNVDYRNAVLGFHLGRSLIGQRVEDIREALDALLARADVDPARVALVGIGAAGPAALHAAALDDRFAELRLGGSIESWIDDVVAKPMARDLMALVVPNALECYDLPDLVKAIAPRPVRVADPFHPVEESAMR